MNVRNSASPDDECQRRIGGLVRQLREQSDCKEVLEHHERRRLEHGVIYGVDVVTRTTTLHEPPDLSAHRKQLRAGEDILAQRQALEPHTEEFRRADLTSGASLIEGHLSVHIELPDGTTVDHPNTGLDLPGEGNPNLAIRRFGGGLIQEIAPDGTVYLIDRTIGAMGKVVNREGHPELKGLAHHAMQGICANTYVITPDGGVIGFELRRNPGKGVPFQPGWELGTLEFIRVSGNIGSDGKLHIHSAPRSPDKVESRTELEFLLAPEFIVHPGPPPEATAEYYSQPDHQDSVVQKASDRPHRGLRDEPGHVRVGGVTLRKRTPKV